MRPALVVCSGLPGVGKSTVARALAAETGAVYLRIDTIEAGLRCRGETFEGQRGDLGYTVADALAADALGLGRSAIVDRVHGWPGAQSLWEGALDGTGAKLLRVLLFCGDEAVHRARIETRHARSGDPVLSTWAEVSTRPFAPDPTPALALDTARLTPAASVTRIRARMPAGDPD